MVFKTASVANLSSQIKTYSVDLLIFAVLLAFSFFISLRNIHDTGPLWADASQYANAGAMLHDCLATGNILRPYAFAKQNYFQYPAFHLPYHPPVYPALLGTFFLITGVGYSASRIFIAICLWLCGCFFYALLRERKLERSTSFAGAVLLLTVPEIALWAADTMSEIPALALLIAASCLFLTWLRTEQFKHYLLALCFAEAAFLSRYLVAGVFVAWVIWVFLFGSWRRLIDRRVVLSLLIFLVFNVWWILFALQFSKFETPFAGPMPNTNYVPMFSLRPLAFDLKALPVMLGWPVLLVAITGAGYLSYKRQVKGVSLWSSWWLCYVIFLLAVGIFHEPRYLLFALPVFPGLVAEFLNVSWLRQYGRAVAIVVLILSLVAAGYERQTFPRGVVGYEAVAHELAKAEGPGNILVAVAEQADLMFRFRSLSPNSSRTFIRADRTLVVRPPDYSNAQTIKIARDSTDVLDIIRRGRIRYLVTSNPDEPEMDDRAEEMITLDNMARAQSQNFELVGTFPLLRQYRRPGSTWRVSLWRYVGELPQTPSELPVRVPTADMEIKPPS